MAVGTRAGNPSMGPSEEGAHHCSGAVRVTCRRGGHAQRAGKGVKEGSLRKGLEGGTVLACLRGRAASVEEEACRRVLASAKRHRSCRAVELCFARLFCAGASVSKGPPAIHPLV